MLMSQSLTQNQIERIHEETLWLMENHGLTFKCEKTLETFRRHGAGIDGQQVFIPSAMVEEAIKNAPSSFTVFVRNPYKSRAVGKGCKPAVTPSGGVAMMMDECGLQRSAVFDDFLKALKLTQTSPVLDFASSVALAPLHDRPMDVSSLRHYYALAMTDMPLIGSSEGEETAAHAIDMTFKATGLTGKPVVVGIFNSLSPMAWDERMLGGLRSYVLTGQPANISCCAMAGATAPVHLSGVVIQSNAEVLAGIVYAQLLKPGAPVIYGTTSSIMDMSTMGLSLGCPEYSIISMACSRLADYYQIPYRSGGSLTDAKVLDGQAGFESAVNLFISLGGGVDFMMQGVGILESYMAISFEKWVADEEIISRFRFMNNYEMDIPHNIREVIGQGVKSGGYLGLADTLKNFRNEFYWPQLGDRRNYEAWKKKGADFQQAANELAAKRLADYQIPELKPEAQKALNASMETGLGAPLLPVKKLLDQLLTASVSLP